ncbi:uncharacterized protein BXZ73DRAFT_105179 [Epithele typhae]|uniref:uncharacterized protein n=1 Tax=Epithele typhae TaxID=378194 RepID=UPI002007CE81|nr:uncharacterized protein BXZ73DRAFT_105179 [Epithele typhae]KAH9918544.1 hypothetical protein BXZ73DRAFT_105179 [Epithele typhae]
MDDEDIAVFCRGISFPVSAQSTLLAFAQRLRLLQDLSLSWEIFIAFRYSSEGPLGQSTAKSLPRAHGKTVVSNKHCAAEEVEATTGVAMLAKDGTPVHHHYSAGIRRSGVFIAVDTGRRKMQKREEG